MRYARYNLEGFTYIGMMDQEFYWLEGNGRTGAVSISELDDWDDIDKEEALSTMRMQNGNYLKRAPKKGLEGLLTLRRDWDFHTRFKLIVTSDLDGFLADIGVPSDEYFVAQIGVCGMPRGVHAPGYSEKQVADYLRGRQELMVSYVFSVPELPEELVSFHCD